MNSPQEYIKKQVAGYQTTLPYDVFCDLCTAVAHGNDISLDEATKIVYENIGSLQVGSQEFTDKGMGKHNKWPGQNQAVNFSKSNPGALAEPMSSFLPIGRIELVAFQIGDRVRVKKNDKAPWGAEYTGFIERINADKTFDIRDEDTDVLYTSQPERLIAVPLATGREDLRIQQRRVGDPKGMGESQLDIGNRNVKQDYPSNTWEPAGHPGQEVKNPFSAFYKQGDQLLTFLLTRIQREYGETSALEVQGYLEGKIHSPSQSLKDILHKYNIVATAGASMLNVEKALGEVKGKTEVMINTETAWTWGSRAAACYKLSNDTNDAKEKEKWVRLGDAYRHESLEHAALAEDDGKLVGEVYKALAPFRKPAGTPEK